MTYFSHSKMTMVLVWIKNSQSDLGLSLTWVWTYWYIGLLLDNLLIYQTRPSYSLLTSVEREMVGNSTSPILQHYILPFFFFLNRKSQSSIMVIFNFGAKYTRQTGLEFVFIIMFDMEDNWNESSFTITTLLQL